SHVIFQRRDDIIQQHKGQISLPGSNQDPTDPDTVYTTLRETQEEIGIDPTLRKVVTTLREVYVPVSGFVITPVVARLKPGIGDRGSGIGVRQQPDPRSPIPDPRDRREPALLFKPNPHEVAEIIEVPLGALRDDAIHRTEVRT